MPDEYDTVNLNQEQLGEPRPQLPEETSPICKIGIILGDLGSEIRRSDNMKENIYHFHSIWIDLPDKSACASRKSNREKDE